MGHLLKRKCSHSPLNLRILSSTSVPFTLRTVQVLNLALTHKKQITVRKPQVRELSRLCLKTSTNCMFMNSASGWDELNFLFVSNLRVYLISLQWMKGSSSFSLFTHLYCDTQRRITCRMHIESHSPLPSLPGAPELKQPEPEFLNL